MDEIVLVLSLFFVQWKVPKLYHSSFLLAETNPSASAALHISLYLVCERIFHTYAIIKPIKLLIGTVTL